MQKFSKHMKSSGFSREDFVFTNSIKCGYDATRWPTKDRHLIEQSCREHLLRFIEEVQPEVIIPLGADAAKAVAGRTVKISKVRGVAQLNREHDTLVLPIMDASYVHFNPQHEPIFASDCKTLGRIVEYDYDLEEAEKSVTGDYKLVKDIQFLVDEEPELLAFDIETVGKRFQEADKKIMMLQFCPEPGRAYVVPWDHPDDSLSIRQKSKIRSQLRALLQNPKTSVVGQGLKFDAVWIFNRLGFTFRIDHDTLMLAAIIDENSMSKDLSTLTKLHVPSLAGYDDTFNSKYDKSRMDLVPIEDMILYGGGDVDACYQVFESIIEEVEDDDMLWAYYRRVAIPAINTFVPIENRGMLVDEKALDEFEKVLAVYVEELRVKLIKQVPRSIKRKHAEKGITFSRSAFLLDILFNHKDGFKLQPKVYTKTTQNLDPKFQVPSTSSKDHLPFFFDHRKAGDFCINLAEWMKMARLLGTNVRKFRENYIVNGKVYPIYSLWTAVTGRCLVGSSMILTDKGSIRIEDLVTRGKRGESFMVLTHNNRWRKVLDFYSNGIKPVLTTYTENCSITSTYDHKFMGFPSWVEASRLKEGDYLYEYIKPPIIEEWKIVVDYTNYEVSNMGTVRRRVDAFYGVYKKGYVLKQQNKGKWGHLKVSLVRGDNKRSNNNRCDIAVHKLVADAFLTRGSESTEVAHLNGVASCNWATNLRWVTSQENKEHTRLHGSSLKVSQRKLTWDIVDDFRAGLLGSTVEAAKTLGVNRRTMYHIKTWQRWNSRRESMTGFAPTMVVDSVSANDCETYDILVEEDHSFIANGVVVHNSASRDPNCFPPEVECLTENGWENFGDIENGTYIAQYDLDTSSIDFSLPLDTIEQDFEGELSSIKTDQFIDILSTSNHRYPVTNRKNLCTSYYTPLDYPKDGLQVCSGLHLKGRLTLSKSHIVLICALQADGIITKHGAIDWGFTKDRKATRLVQYLREEDIPYKDYSSNGKYRFYVSKKDIPEYLSSHGKRFNKNILNYSPDTLLDFCSELCNWDGDYTRRSTWVSVNKSDADLVQAAYTLNGDRATVHERSNHTCKSFYVVKVTAGLQHNHTANRVISKVPYKGKVHCYTMPKDTLVVRYKGKVIITGNSQNYPNKGKQAKAYKRIFIAPPGESTIDIRKLDDIIRLLC